MFSAFDLGTFVTILLLTFSFVLLIAGIFTAYFGSGKSRKIGGGLLAIGLILGIVWVVLTMKGGPMDGFADVTDAVVNGIGVLLAAFIGAAAAIGLFLLAIMKS